jgi:hypothetical protein
MTIAKRLVILLMVPLAALVALSVFTRLQLGKIEERSRFVAESRIVALATLGNLSRGFSELRVNVRSYLLALSDAQRAAARKAFDEDERDVNRLLEQYADHLGPRRCISERNPGGAVHGGHGHRASRGRAPDRGTRRYPAPPERRARSNRTLAACS